METRTQLHEYRGAVHVHSTYSDGTRSIPEIARIAGECGLDFVLINDHMTLDGRAQEGWYGDVLVLVGYEANDADDNNHYLAYGTGTVSPKNERAAQYVDHTRAEGGVGFIAHPDEQRTEATGYRGYPWTDWGVEGYDGIEIWNQMSEWVEQITPLNKVLKVFFPRRTVTAPRAGTLARWDRLSRTRKVVGIGGTDVHAFTYRLGPFSKRIFPYKVYFKTIRSHLLLDAPLDRNNLAAARRAVYGALKQGNLFFTNFRRGDAFGFRCRAEAGGAAAPMGGAVPLHRGSAEVRVALPRPADIRLLCDGETVASFRGRELRHAADRPGAYRAEAAFGKKGWIYGNHIRITEE